MKNICFIAIVVLLATLGSCKKGEMPSETVDVTYPVITMNGAPVLSVNTGGTVNDPGASVYDSITGETSTVYGDLAGVDVTTPGLYFLVYKAKNKYGFESIGLRPVAVTDIDPSWDLSGTYARTSNGVEVQVTELANGLYVTDNFGGVPSSSPDFIFPAYFVQIDDATIDMPLQEVPGLGIADFTDDQLIIASPDTAFAYKVDNPSFGTALRTFQKM